VVDVALEHGAPDALPVVGVLVVADADAPDGLLRVQPEGVLFRLELLCKRPGRLDVAVVLQELEDLSTVRASPPLPAGPGKTYQLLDQVRLRQARHKPGRVGEPDFVVDHGLLLLSIEIER
jgi:hypothetical protein